MDFRLRPSGNSGPLATHIESFAIYQAKDAWTWEHMALTRARPVAGDARMLERARAEIATVLTRPHEPTKVTADVLEMRAMVEDAKGGAGLWDLKQTPAGLVDIEFVAQALQLAHGAAHPEIIATETEAVLVAAEKAGLFPAKEADVLLSALRLYRRCSRSCGSASRASSCPPTRRADYWSGWRAPASCRISPRWKRMCARRRRRCGRRSGAWLGKVAVGKR
ncbi:MAG: hypothetical protein WDM84_07730 [Bauldia sp.]